MGRRLGALAALFGLVAWLAGSLAVFVASIWAEVSAVYSLKTPINMVQSLQTAEGSGTVTRVSLKDAVEGFERDLIQDALKTTRGNRAKAARLLDSTERIINYKVKQYGIDAARFRS